MSSIVRVGNTSAASLSVLDEGSPLARRPSVNFVGTGVTVSDDPVNDRSNVVISTSTGSSDTTVFYAEDYGAAGDGTGNDGPAWSAAYTAASAAGGPGRPAVIRGLRNANYRITTSIIVKQYVVVESAKFTGGITGAARISSTNNPAVPAATDVAGQTAGACFTDSGGTGTIPGLEWRDCRITLFRYGMMSTAFAWPHPVLRDVFFENCNIGFIAYQGCQEPRLYNVASGGATPGTTFVAAVTCFASGHPSAGLDNFFCDGLIYDNAGHLRDGADTNATFDAWFEAAILRPDTTSVVVNGSRTFPFTGVARQVSGRNIYIPSRNNRQIFSPTIRKAITEGAELGVALVCNPVFGSFHNISGENMFSAGAQSMLLILISSAGSTANTATFYNIDSLLTTGTALAAIEVQVASGVTPNVDFRAQQVAGTIIGTEHFAEYGLPGLGWGVGPTSFIDPIHVTSTTATAGTANRTHYYRVRDGGSISKVSLHVGTASGNLAVAVYRNTGTGQNAKPGTRFASSGSVACPAAGFRDIALGQTVRVRAGDWLAFAADNTTATFAAFASTQVLATSGLFNGRAGFEDVYPPPATATPTMGLGRGISLVGN